MEKQTPQELIDKYLLGKTTPDEKTIVESWYLMRGESMEDTLPEPDYAALGNEMWPVIDKQTPPGRKVFRLLPRIAAVSMVWKIAAAVTAITLGVWLYYASGLFDGLKVDGRHAEFSSASPYDIAPGKNMATLTLANGETINLSDTKTGVVIDASSLKYNDGSEVASVPRNDGQGAGHGVQTLIAATPRGGTYRVTLPDGTKVWLNAESKISFPSRFSGTTRKILLSGEAYFEVVKAYVSLSPSKGQTKRVRQSFIVESGNQQVEVLGTHFNVNAYKDESAIKTTLLEGSVKVNGIILKPNQQAVLMASSKINVLNVNTEEFVSWQKGYFRFNDEKLSSIMKKLSRWYNIEVVYEGNVADDGITGTISRSKNISQVLSMLEKTKGIHFKISGRRVTISE